MLWITLGILISYFIGSLPTAYIFGRLLKGIDIRNFGSGNVGATNALRVLGVGPGIAVLVLDMLKGFVTVFFLGNFIASKIISAPELVIQPGVLVLPISAALVISDETLRIILGLSCICGHNWSIFLRFRGGKGIATTFGVLFGLSIKLVGLKLILGLTILTWLLIFIIVRIVSVASVLSGIALPIYMIIFKQSNVLIFLSVLLCIFIILRHKSNLKRVFQGKESRLTFKNRCNQRLKSA